MKNINKKPATKPKQKAQPVRKLRGGTVAVGQKFADAEREQIKNHCARLYLEGYSNYGMTLWLEQNTEWKVSQPTVRAYIDDILDDWHSQRISDVDKAITGQLMKLQRAEREAWDAWERSKTPQVKKVSRKKGTPTTNKAGAVIAVTATEFEDVEETQESVGDYRFLDLFNRLVMQQLELLNKGGFNKPDDPSIYTGNTYVQQVVYVETVDRRPPPQNIDIN